VAKDLPETDKKCKKGEKWDQQAKRCFNDPLVKMNGYLKKVGKAMKLKYDELSKKYD